jgi:hypothetical protein
MTAIQRITFACIATALPLMCAAGEDVRYAFECDTPAAHFSYWNRSVSSGVIEISGKLTVNALLEDKKWSPGAHVFFRAGKEKPRTVGLRIYAITKTPDLLFLEMLKMEGSEKIGLGLMPRTKEPIPFTLQIDSTGLLKATVAGSEASANLGDFKPDSLQLSCSTGDFEFTDVTVNEKP